MEGKKKDWWFRGIAFISILYFVAVWSILLMNLWYSPPSPKLGLNEVGDYLAGAFSPLAFFWLAYGYWMQNKELRSNNNHQSKFLDISEKQLRLQNNMMQFETTKEFNESQAFFKISYLKSINNKISIEIININATVFDFIFSKYSERGIEEDYHKKIFQDEALEIEISLDETLEEKKEIENSILPPTFIHKEGFRISYTDKFERLQNIDIKVISSLKEGKNINYDFIFYNIRKPLPEF